MGPLKIILRDGKKVDALTDAALKAAERKLGYKLTVTQGSYNTGGVAASAGTHDCGGVVDLAAWDHDNKIKALRAVGFAAWYRPTIAGLWPEHCHAVLIGHPALAPSAARQVTAYLDRRDGLASNLPNVDPGWTNSARFTWDDHLAEVALRGELTDAVRAARKADRPSLADRLRKIRDGLRP